MSAANETRQLIDSSEIKQEPDIKEEPQSTGNLAEYPALDHHGDRQSSVISNQFGNDGDSVNASIVQFKVEVKEETSERNKKKSNRNKDAPNKKRNDKTVISPKETQKNSVRKSAEKQHQCEQCEYSTKYKQVLKTHLLTHTGENPFPCDRCKRAFTRKEYLQSHMRAHVEEYMFHCVVCSKGFDQNNMKIKHEIDCKLIRYECHLCNNSFGSKKSSLISHMRVHGGSKPFGCKECSKEFATKCSLKRHMRLHFGPRPFRCSICREGFTQQNEMIAHQLKCNRRMYECYVCGKSFGLKKENLVRHMPTHTGHKPFGCNQCPKKFVQKRKLNKHLEIHSRSLPWKCMICRQGFSMLTQWEAHQKNCTRRVYECYRCKKFMDLHNFSLKIHMRTHSGEKPFQCEICSIQFSLKGNLNRHLNSIHNTKH